MKIIMQEGYEITDEIKNLYKQIDFNYFYIDNYGQMKEAELKNKQLIEKLKNLNVISINK